MTDTELGGYDDEQVQMMKENCIVVDETDTIIGNDPKVSCHLGEVKLHRAFSVLFFNSKILSIAPITQPTAILAA